MAKGDDLDSLNDNSVVGPYLGPNIMQIFKTLSSLWNLKNVCKLFSGISDILFSTMHWWTTGTRHLVFYKEDWSVVPRDSLVFWPNHESTKGNCTHWRTRNNLHFWHRVISLLTLHKPQASRLFHSIRLKDAVIQYVSRPGADQPIRRERWLML